MNFRSYPVSFISFSKIDRNYKIRPISETEKAEIYCFVENFDRNVNFQQILRF